MPCGTAHAYECREAGEEEKRRRRREENNANKQTKTPRAVDAGSSQNGGIHGISDSGTGNVTEFKKSHRNVSGMTCNGLHRSAASISTLSQDTAVGNG
jgi:hypothetical protein